MRDDSGRRNRIKGETGLIKVTRDYVFKTRGLQFSITRDYVELAISVPLVTRMGRRFLFFEAIKPQ